MNIRTLRIYPKRNSLQSIILGGLVIRLTFFIILVTVGLSVSNPYFLEDDIKYERLAQLYLNSASSLFDLNAFKIIGAASYLTTFWPWVMCVSAFFFRNIYAGRIINIILSVISIKLTYDVTYKICLSEKTGLHAAKLFAFLPLTVMTCCFPIKDIFLTYSALYFFRYILSIQNGEKIKLTSTLYCVILLICTYFTRGALVGLYSIFGFVYLFDKLYKEKKYGWNMVLVVVGIILMFLFGNVIVNSFVEKIDVYSRYGLENMGGIALVRITSLRDLYKLPLTYLFALLQPMKTDLFTINMNSFWLSILGYLNLSLYPIAMGSFLYLFMKKHNFLFWLSTFVLYSSVISLSLGIFRHYLFMAPLGMINFALVNEYKTKLTQLFIYGGSLVLLMFILIR